jgi:hypothetical protein
MLAPGLLSAEHGLSAAVLSLYQGIVHKRGGYSALVEPGSHGKHQLGVAGLLGEFGGIAMMVDLAWEHDLYMQGQNQLNDTIAYVPRKVFGEYKTEYVTEFKLCQSSIFNIAQCYRDYKISRNEFKTWDNKLEQTPGLEHMFGAVQFFMGYFDSPHDYISALRQVKEMGFKRGFVYPAVFRNYHPDMLFQGNVPFINLGDKLVDIKNLGYHVASWSWPEEMRVGPGSEVGLWGMLGVGENGAFASGWAAGDFTWYSVASEAQVQFMRWAQENMWTELSAQHFDVTGNKVFTHYYGHKKYGPYEDVQCRRALFEQAAKKGPVSTEGFCDGFIETIHCGSVLARPAFGESDWWTVPLNSIVYHDSAMNVWWEADSYNNPYHRTQSNRHLHAVQAGGGDPLQQSLLDALQGTPPNVFLCGRMYRPSDGVHFKDGYDFYEIGFEDDTTQIALQLARPVAELHRLVGKQQIVGYEILTENAQVQRTVFQDGTTVTVNFGKSNWTNGEISVDGESWIRSY